MKGYAVITSIGTDRIGIVDDITNAILARDCNVEESRMSVLGGEFAVIVLISGSSESIERLEKELADVDASAGMHSHLKRTQPRVPDPHTRPYLIQSVSLDTPGILHAVTHLLSTKSISIEDLETDTTAAPWTGAPMFIMRARVLVPEAVNVAELREEMEDLALDQDLDIKIEPEHPVA